MIKSILFSDSPLQNKRQEAVTHSVLRIIMDHPIRWESVEFADKATYEGLTRADQAHVRGVMTFSDGSYYCGEFRDNEYSGFGVYSWPAHGDAS